ncbi:MAG: DNA replication/repair protein RecF [endosymbiont of Seepiophila jonesi]|uniref:DNA replication and repair protein RecF n=1 Tax=endosymbiont of Lamellibrachia luymesi TaxID=2200907 RepID=A0A370DXY6_9GAMM|nr:MAG: DNA replication/repair protein RecF [endosymbiont of Lamellibrachia luymesi]RDH91171.1 MAG: DNA replication/repair protein RecF [endosymbiont of Seepiophila jonesi]
MILVKREKPALITITVFFRLTLNITKLQIQNLRILDSVDLSPQPGINIFCGDNGSGKTSLLEAIFLLARAKSFKNIRAKNLIQEGKEKLSVYSETQQTNHSIVRIGFDLDKNKKRIQLNGTPVSRVSEVAKLLPIGIVTPIIHRLIEEGPDNRRRFLNRGVFHVEHSYISMMRHYSTTLQQRNASLRAGDLGWNVWDAQLIDYGDQINQLRADFFSSWKSVFQSLAATFPSVPMISFSFYKGWNKSLSLEDSLHAQVKTDLSAGFTTTGPHRADIRITVNSLPAKEILSRGQQKIVATLMVLSQLIAHKERKNINPILLMDDFSAELDLRTTTSLLSLIDSSGFQTFLTAIDSETVTGKYSNKVEMFHVERGAVK